MKSKEKAICEKAVALWGQALSEGYTESWDSSGLTIDIFKGAHYAIGALKGFWTPSQAGFKVINQAITDLEELLSDVEEESLEDNSTSNSVEVRELAIHEPSNPGVKWRIQKSYDSEGNNLYITQGVNGYSVRRYFEETLPGELIEFEDKQVMPSEIPLSATLENEYFDEAWQIWIQDSFGIEIIRDPEKVFQVEVEVDNDEFIAYELHGHSRSIWSKSDSSTSNLQFFVNSVIQSFENVRVIFLRSTE